MSNATDSLGIDPAQVPEEEIEDHFDALNEIIRTATQLRIDLMRRAIFAGWSQQRVAKKIGKSQASVSKTLRALGAPKKA
jgi:hypothetical protein